MFQKSLLAAAISTATGAAAFAAKPATSALASSSTAAEVPLIQVAAMDPVVVSAALIEQKL